MELRVLKQSQLDRDIELAKYLNIPVNDITQYKIAGGKSIRIVDKKLRVQEKGQLIPSKVIDLYQRLPYLDRVGYFRTLMHTSVKRRPRELFKVLGRRMEGKLVLDFGTGAGTHTILAMENKAKVHALDVAGPLVNLASWRFRLRGYRSPGNYLILPHDADLGEERYDVAICVEVLEHVPTPSTVMARMIRAMKRGGLLFILVSKKVSDRGGHFTENINDWLNNGLPLLKAASKTVSPYLYKRR